jgi:hypothetical protein
VKTYVVVKASRKGTNRTYAGSSWEVAGLQRPEPVDSDLPLGMHEYPPFENFEQADRIATRLSMVNPVGFVVEEYVPAKTEVY